MTLFQQKILLGFRILTAWWTYAGFLLGGVAFIFNDVVGLLVFASGGLSWMVNALLGPVVKSFAADAISERKANKLRRREFCGLMDQRA